MTWSSRAISRQSLRSKAKKRIAVEGAMHFGQLDALGQRQGAR